MGLVFIDTETTGLNPETDQLIEVAWATLENPEPKTLIFPHDRNNVTPGAAAVNNYYGRGLGNPKLWCSVSDELLLFEELKGQTLVGANIAFDESFLAKKCTYRDYDVVPWHYRKLDIESIAYHAFRYPQKVPGMKDIFEVLVAKGYDLPEPDHTAAGDVRTLIRAFEILREL